LTSFDQVKLPDCREML